LHAFGFVMNRQRRPVNIVLWRYASFPRKNKRLFFAAKSQTQKKHKENLIFPVFLVSWQP